MIQTSRRLGVVDMTLRNPYCLLQYRSLYHMNKGPWYVTKHEKSSVHEAHSFCFHKANWTFIRKQESFFFWQSFFSSFIFIWRSGNRTPTSPISLTNAGQSPWSLGSPQVASASGGFGSGLFADLPGGAAFVGPPYLIGAKSAVGKRDSSMSWHSDATGLTLDPSEGEEMDQEWYTHLNFFSLLC